MSAARPGWREKPRPRTPADTLRLGIDGYLALVSRITTYDASAMAAITVAPRSMRSLSLYMLFAQFRKLLPT